MLRQRNMEKGYLWNLVLVQEKTGSVKLDFDFIKELTIFDENNNEYNLLGPKREEDKKNGILTELYWEELDAENYDLRKAVGHSFGQNTMERIKKQPEEPEWSSGIIFSFPTHRSVRHRSHKLIPSDVVGESVFKWENTAHAVDQAAFRRHTGDMPG